MKSGDSQQDPQCPEWLRKLDVTPNTIEYHLGRPEQSPDEYIRSRHIDLGAEVLKKKRIYLDQNYWIYCREAARGRPKCAEHALLYDMLKAAVGEGKLICPASHIILEETLKQSDDYTKALTAQTVQELSAGIAIQPFPVLIQAEVLHFLVATRPWKVDCYPVEQLAWTYIGNVFGHDTPKNIEYDQAVTQAIQKAWFDYMAQMEFSPLIEAMSSMPNKMRSSLLTDDYGQMNAECEKHRGEYSSFKQIFMVEVAGILDAYKQEFADAVRYLYEKYAGVSHIVGTDAGQDEVGLPLMGMIYRAFELNKITTQLAGLRVMAGIHAAARYRRQKFRSGDRHDHLHARVALPYCNAFLTERNLGHLLTSKPLEYDQLYGCKVVWDADKAVSVVGELIKSPLN